MFRNPRRSRQARKKFHNKCSENSRSQIVFQSEIFRKVMLCAPEVFTLPVTQAIIGGGGKMGIFVKLIEDNTHFLSVI